MLSRRSGPIWGVPLDPSNAYDVRRRLEAPLAGLAYPLLYTRDPHRAYTDEPFNPDQPAAILNRAASTDAAQFFLQNTVLLDNPSSIQLSTRDTPPIRAARERLFLLLIPAANHWEVMAHLQFGGRNLCPEHHVHIAVMKDWLARFGARPVLARPVPARYDILEFEVDRPPASPIAALALAVEHEAYCPDAPIQVHDNIPSLASTLLNSSHWHFWWD